MTDDQDPGPLVRALRSPVPGHPGPALLTAAGPLDRTPCRLYGDRGMFRPRVALQTIQRLGPARHAIAQRTVAGTVEIHAPWAPKPEPAKAPARTPAPFGTPGPRKR